MKILITGAFGNIGYNVVLKLSQLGHEIIAFDLPNKNNLKKYNLFQKNYLQKGLISSPFRVIWGNILNCKELEDALLSVETVIHLAAIIPNLSEKNKELANKVNIGGTERLVNILKQSKLTPKIVFASTIAVHGSTMHLKTSLTADMPYNPINNYSSTKVEAENLLKTSGLNYVILRFTASLDPDFSNMLTMENLSNYYEFPIEQRIEFLDARDAATALSNAILPGIDRQIYLIGGGSNCQFIYSEFIDRLFSALGIGILPRNIFKLPKTDQDWFTVNWLNTTDAQAVLQYQNHSFDEFLTDMRRKMLGLRILIFMFKPIVRLIIIQSSPYRKKQ